MEYFLPYQSSAIGVFQHEPVSPEKTQEGDTCHLAVISLAAILMVSLEETQPVRTQD